MKICFITANLIGGGAERVIANLANCMVNQGHSVNILLTAGRDIEYDFHPSIDIMQISEKTGRSVKGRLDRIWKLRKYFKDNRDTYFIAMPTETNMFALIAAIGLNMKLTISERSNPNAFSKKYLRNLIYILAKKMVFQTEDAMKCYSKKLQKIGTIIPNPICDNYPEPYQGERTKRIVSVGRFEEEKNHKMLIRAFAKVSETYPEYELWLYGKGTLENDLKQLSIDLGIEKKVFFPGFSDNVVRDIYDAAIYVLPSNYEGLSNSLMEAMALGIPVIATDCPIGGSKVLIQDYINGLLTPVNDDVAMSKAMKRYLADTTFATSLGLEASKVKTKYQIDSITNMWIRYISC